MQFFQVHHFLGMKESWQDFTQQSLRLQSYSKYKITQQTIVYPQHTVDVCASNSSVILQSVQELWSHHVLTSDHQNLVEKKKFSLSGTSPIKVATH